MSLVFAPVFLFVIDETYVKVGKGWKYLCRAVDSTGCTTEFMLSARRDVSAARRFFKKLMRADHRRLPFTIGADKHASYRGRTNSTGPFTSRCPGNCLRPAGRLSRRSSLGR